MKVVQLKCIHEQQYEMQDVYRIMSINLNMDCTNKNAIVASDEFTGIKTFFIRSSLVPIVFVPNLILIQIYLNELICNK